jgi:hypothetical protein
MAVRGLTALAHSITPTGCGRTPAYLVDVLEVFAKGTHRNPELRRDLCTRGPLKHFRRDSEAKRAHPMIAGGPSALVPAGARLEANLNHTSE